MNNGKQGEQLFQQIMQQRGYQVVDVSNNSQYFDKDIDVLLTSSTTGETKSFEIKWDTKLNSTGNLFIEMINPRSEGCCGWFEFIQADYLAYGDSIAKQFYIIDVEYLKDFMAKKKRIYEYKRCSDGAEGYLIPLEHLKYKIL